jgi:hypothetical protein
MIAQRVTKRTVDAIQSNGSEFTVWSAPLTVDRLEVGN